MSQKRMLTEKQIVILRLIRSKDRFEEGKTISPGWLSRTVDQPHMPTINKLVRLGNDSNRNR